MFMMLMLNIEGGNDTLSHARTSLKCGHSIPVPVVSFLYRCGNVVEHHFFFLLILLIMPLLHSVIYKCSAERYIIQI
jgi:hypothetical protein